VSNASLKRRLGMRLRYPTYREGLAAIAAGDADPFSGWEDVRVMTGRGKPVAAGL